MNERRAAPRHQLSVPITGWIHNSLLFEGTTRDISTGGAYIRTNRPAKVGDFLVFLMRFPTTYPEQREDLLWAYCRAVRVDTLPESSGYSTGIATVAIEYSLSLRDSAIERLVSRSAA